MEIKQISNGTTLAVHTTDQFKTAVLALSMTAPLDEHCAERALLIRLLARTNKDYPSTLAMNRALASLYGATITPSISKVGETQVLRLLLTVLDDRFTLENESICKDCIHLLCSCLFAPNVTTEGFSEESLALEKRLLIETIDSEKDDKRIFACQRMIEEMCCNEAYGQSKYGDKARIEQLTGKDVFNAWKDVLLHSSMQIAFVGSTPQQALETQLQQAFSNYKKEALNDLRTEFLTESYGSKTVREAQPVKQGKLVIGYRADMTYDMDNYAAIRLMTSIFGGGTYSKLFMNVREKMSLCYYCSARLVSSKGIIIVESGVETENAQQALEAIRHELDEVRAGNFSDEVIAQAKLSLCDSLRSVSDSNLSLLSWFGSFCSGGDFYTPQQIADMIQTVSREEIVLAANMITEDTVYILESAKEDAGHANEEN